MAICPPRTQYNIVNCRRVIFAGGSLQYYTSTVGIHVEYCLWSGTLVYTCTFESSPLFEFQQLPDEHGQSHKIVEKYAGILAENMCYIM